MVQGHMTCYRFKPVYVSHVHHLQLHQSVMCICVEVRVMHKQCGLPHLACCKPLTLGFEI